MPKQVCSGIVLRTVDYRESDRILNVFSKEHGLITVTARGCRKLGSKLGIIANQFCYGELELYQRSGKFSLASAELLQSFYPIRESYEQLLSATRIVKMTERISEPETANEPLFLLVYNALSLIAYGDNDPADIELCFAAKLLKLAGYAPVLTYCVKCGKDLRSCKELRFSNALGGSLCDECGGPYVTVSALSLEALRRMLNLEVADMRKVRLPEAVRKELEPLIYGYAEYVFEVSFKM